MTIVLELFAGAGGAALGLHRAGWEHAASIEWDEDACRVLAAALPEARVRCGDVRDEALYADVGPVDFLWASPPCQAFSSAGKRLGARDERNGWPWTLRVIDWLRLRGWGPTWCVCENVPGLTHHRSDCGWDGQHGGPPEDCPGCYWERVVLTEFRARFAHVQTAILDAADFGVAQRRRRVFLLAGPCHVEWPATTHADPRCPECDGRGSHPTPLLGPVACASCRGTGASEAVRVLGLRPWRTVRDALGVDAWATETGFSGAGRPRELRSADEPSCQPVAGGKALGGLLAVLMVGGNRGRASVAGGEPRGPLIAGTDRPAWTVDRTPSGIVDVASEHVGRGLLPQWHRPLDPDAPADAVQGVGEGPRPPMVLAGSCPGLLDAPSPAVCASEEKGARHMGNATVGRTPMRASDALWRATGVRRLTVGECARLQAWPELGEYGDPAAPISAARTKTAAYRVVGNAVPPPVAEALGRAVAAAVAATT